MSARDVVFGLLSNRTKSSSPFAYELTDHILADLTAAGFSIVHKDEIHAPTVERCAETVEKRNYPCVGDARRIAAALRELMKEVGRG